MTTFQTSRDIPATPAQVFAAFTDPQRLARWWGPAGFTNTFNVCEFKPGGRWSLVMHGPDGKNYPNENVFAEVQPPTKVVVEHPSEPKYRLTITLAPSAVGTIVWWAQTFENAESHAASNTSSCRPMTRISSAYRRRYCARRVAADSTAD